MTFERVSVGLGERAYDIVIGEGIIERAGEILAPLLRRKRTVVITDANVFAAQGKRLAAALAGGGLAAETIVLPPGESTKSFPQLERLVSRLIDLDVDRSDLIIAFGGGVVGDIAGFAAAIVKRGCRYAQIPTSLLAQVDSAVGGKTAINVAQGKNLVGVFHQPAIVLSDVAVLKTLPERELRAGYAEVIKYGALGDATFFAWLEENGDRVLRGDTAARAYAVRRCCEMKAQIVAADEREAGPRALLNLGHTFGHALEAALGFSQQLLHGEAVAAGMGLAFDFSVDQGTCPPEEAARVKALLRKAGLPTGLESLPSDERLSPDNLVELMRRDKKAVASAMTLVLVHGVGKAFLAPGAVAEQVKRFLIGKSGRKTAGEERK